MSSSRRRGRPTGPSAKTLVNTAAPAAAAPEIAEAAVAETSAVAIAAAEGTPLEASVQEADKAADETQDQAGTAEAAEQSAEPAHEAAETAETAAAEDGATAEAPPAEDAAAQEASGREPADVAIEDVAAAQQDEAVEPVAAMAETVAEAALLPALAEPVLAEPVLAEPVLAEPAGEAAALRTETLTRRVRIGASFVFSPTLVPLTEINAKLFAFARGEGEAALAHFQALARAKSPAEAIRLQVTEMQRAADASLTCFSEIVRSANRLSETARWH